MARKRYLETRSNYTLKKLHQVTSKGNVYESDLMTITEPGTFAPGQIPVYTDSNFKLSIRGTEENHYKNRKTPWVYNGNSEVWTKTSASTATTSTSIVDTRPNVTSLLNFACYGSATELVRASLLDIIKNFPAELYLTDRQYDIPESIQSTATRPLGGEDKYLVENPYSINIVDQIINNTTNINELRYFCQSYRDYVFIPDNEQYEKSYIGWSIKNNVLSSETGYKFYSNLSWNYAYGEQANDIVTNASVGIDGEISVKYLVKNLSSQDYLYFYVPADTSFYLRFPEDFTVNNAIIDKKVTWGIGYDNGWEMLFDGYSFYENILSIKTDEATYFRISTGNKFRANIIWNNYFNGISYDKAQTEKVDVLSENNFSDISVSGNGWQYFYFYVPKEETLRFIYPYTGQPEKMRVEAWNEVEGDGENEDDRKGQWDIAEEGYVNDGASVQVYGYGGMYYRILANVRDRDNYYTNLKWNFWYNELFYEKAGEQEVTIANGPEYKMQEQHVGCEYFYFYVPQDSDCYFQFPNRIQENNVILETWNEIEEQWDVAEEGYEINDHVLYSDGFGGLYFRIKVFKDCFCDEVLISTINLGICKLYYYYYDGEKILVHDYKYGTAHIRPKDSLIEDFYSNLDDFEYALLNRKTNHTITLDTFRETNKGIKVRKEKYTWPTSYGWNLDYNTSNYTQYANSLYDLAKLCDEYYTDNIDRKLTHEALKNFDWTHNLVRDSEDIEYTDPNSYRIEAILRIYGRMFDDLRTYIKNIKTMTTVSYNGINNIPDIFLNDLLEMSGWETVFPLSGNTVVSDVLYPALYQGYTNEEASSFFLRNLKLSTAYIFNQKGTKQGIETLLALFGFHSEDYLHKRKYLMLDASGNTIEYSWDELDIDTQRKYMARSFNMNEYIAVATNDEEMFGYSNCDNEYTRRINAYKDGYRLPLNDEEDINDIELQGIPVKRVDISIPNTNGTLSYLVPWFDKDKEYDNPNLYFQSRGGWGQHENMNISIETYGALELTSDSAFTIYDETQTYLHFCDRMINLTQIPYYQLGNGDIYYVDSLGDTSLYNTIGEGAVMSHYFIIGNVDSTDVLGYDSDNNRWGWKNISEEEIKNQSSKNGKMVLYLESILNNRKGNNPHVGYGNYDSGEEYLNSFRKLFKDSTFETVSDYQIEGYDKVGFTLEKQVDNQKCWYFTNTYDEDGSLVSLEETGAETYEKIDSQPVEVKKDWDTTSLRKTDIAPYNMEIDFNSLSTTAITMGEPYDEAAANSIINLKNFELSFYPDVKLGISQYDFINDIVMFYVKQIIPSTTIFSYHIPDVGLSTRCPGDESKVIGATSGFYTI